MSKPVPPKEQPRQAAPRGGPTQTASSKTPTSGAGPQRTESKSPMPQVSRPRVIESPAITQEQIALRAYLLWEQRGRPEGTDRENWFEAERQLQRAFTPARK